MFVPDVTKALLVRLVLLVHSLLVIWLAANMKNDPLYWLLTIGNLGMIIEAIVTVVKNKAKEWRWYVLLANNYIHT